MSAPARGGLLNLLVPAELDRRAIDETLADWRLERSQASGAARVRAEVRGLAACTRTLAGCAVTPFAHPDIWRYLVWTLTLSIVLSVVFTAGVTYRWHWPAEGAPPQRAWYLLVPNTLVLTMGIAAVFGCGLRNGRKLPVLAVVPLTIVGMLLLAGWVVPEWNQFYRETVAAEFAPAFAPPARGLAEQSLTALLTELRSEVPAKREWVRRALTMKAAVVLLTVCIIVLGEAIRRRLFGRVRWRVVQAASGLGALAIAATPMVASVPVIVSLPASWSAHVSGYHANWFAAIGVVVLATCWLARQTPNHDRISNGSGA